MRPYADKIHGVPTVREADGLAMSSRNAYLTAEERGQAAALPRAMRAAVEAIEAGGDIGAALAEAERALRAGGFVSVDYVELRDPDSLAPVTALGEGGGRLLVAARIGRARLIDNMPVNRRANA